MLKIGSRLRYPLGSYSDSNAMHFYNILTVGQFSRKLSQIIIYNQHTNEIAEIILYIISGNSNIVINKYLNLITRSILDHHAATCKFVEMMSLDIIDISGAAMKLGVD